LQKRRNKLQPIATIGVFIVVVLEVCFRGRKLDFQRVSNADATAAALPAKS
jgi:hypothetical protein